MKLTYGMVDEVIQFLTQRGGPCRNIDEPFDDLIFARYWAGREERLDSLPQKERSSKVARKAVAEAYGRLGEYINSHYERHELCSIIGGGSDQDIVERFESYFPRHL